MKNGRMVGLFILVIIIIKLLPSAQREPAKIVVAPSASAVSNLASAESEMITNAEYEYSGLNAIVCGIEFKIDSIELKQNRNPDGYVVTLKCSITNTNTEKASFTIDDGGLSRFFVDDSYTRLATQISSKHYFELDGNESAESNVVMFAGSNLSSSYIMDGIEYYPIDISSVYSDQRLSIDILVRGAVNERSEEDIMSILLTD